MNLLEGTLIGTREDPRVDAGVFAAPVPPESFRSAGEHLGAAVVYGIRPEDIRVADGANGQIVNAKVEVVEYLGNELQLHCSVGAKSFVVRVPTGLETYAGATLPLRFDAKRAHVFDAVSEKALC